MNDTPTPGDPMEPSPLTDWEAKYVRLQWAAIDLIKDMENTGTTTTASGVFKALKEVVFPKPTPAQEAQEALNAYDDMIEDGKPPSLDILLDAISQVKEGRSS